MPVPLHLYLEDVSMSDFVLSQMDDADRAGKDYDLGPSQTGGEVPQPTTAEERQEWLRALKREAEMFGSLTDPTSYKAGVPRLIADVERLERRLEEIEAAAALVVKEFDKPSTPFLREAIIEALRAVLHSGQPEEGEHD